MQVESQGVSYVIFFSKDGKFAVYKIFKSQYIYSFSGSAANKTRAVCTMSYEVAPITYIFLSVIQNKTLLYIVNSHVFITLLYKIFTIKII